MRPKTTPIFTNTMVLDKKYFFIIYIIAAMDLNLTGYFSRFDKFNNIHLVNLEPSSMEKLVKCDKTLYPGACEHKSPVLPNGVIIKHNTRALSYDIEGVPTPTSALMGQLVNVKVRTKKYALGCKHSEERTIGWTMSLLKITPAI